MRLARELYSQRWKGHAVQIRAKAYLCLPRLQEDLRCCAVHYKQAEQNTVAVAEQPHISEEIELPRIPHGSEKLQHALDTASYAVILFAYRYIHVYQAKQAVLPSTSELIHLSTYLSFTGCKT
jgi:hypothetical protein